MPEPLKNQQNINPLHHFHESNGAEFQAWADIEIVQTFGQPQAEYAALRRGAALIDWPQRGCIEVAGKDRHAFLNNLLTNQLWDKSRKAPIQSGQVVRTFMLNLKGRIVADINVVELGERTVLETDRFECEPLIAAFEKYRFVEKVTFTDKSNQWHVIGRFGRGSNPYSGSDGEKALDTRIAEVDAIVFQDRSVGVPGVKVICNVEDVLAVWTHFLTPVGEGTPAVRPIGWAAYNASRIEAGTPILGIDFEAAPIVSAWPGAKDIAAAGALPAETGLFDAAVSVTKGCYLGQEIVARMHARSAVARKVVGLRMDGDALPIAGAALVDAAGNQIGIVTSSTVSPILSNAPIALATLKRPSFEPGTEVSVAAEGAMRSARVVALPIIPVES